jgi:PAS domain S-box-containing protein
MSAVLVFVVPTYLVMALVAGLTRKIPVNPTDVILGTIAFASSVVAYALNRTERYQRGALLLTVTAIIGTTLVGAREPDPVRAIFSVLIAVTGPLYASFLLSARVTLVSALFTLAAIVGVMFTNPAIETSMAVIPIFFAAYVLSLTVVSATLRERHISELEQAAALLRSTLDASQDAAVIIDAAGHVTEWSLVAARLLSVPASEAIGRDLSSLVHGVQLTPGKEPARIEFSAERLDGTSFSCEGLLAPLPDGRSAVFLRDVSDRKQMEARLMMTDRLETMGRMVAGVAHEINNPLAYVSANLNFLTSVIGKEETPVVELQSVLQETSEGARRIQSIVQDLRIFSRSGEFEAVTPIHVEAIIDSVITIAQPRLREARAIVTRDFARVDAVLGIESRLAQVFLNLIVNAAQALTETSQREIIVSTRREGDRVVIGVRDFGPGVPEELRSRLFSPFFTTKPAGQGTGLGLYISQSIITGLKGELRVTNASPGALFEVSLPAVS